MNLKLGFPYFFSLALPGAIAGYLYKSVLYKLVITQLLTKFVV